MDGALIGPGWGLDRAWMGLDRDYKGGLDRAIAHLKSHESEALSGGETQGEM